MILKTWQYANDQAGIAERRHGQGLPRQTLAPYSHLILSYQLNDPGVKAELLGQVKYHVERALAVSQRTSSRGLPEGVSTDGY